MVYLLVSNRRFQTVRVRIATGILVALPSSPAMDAVRGPTNAPAVRLPATLLLFAASLACQSTRPAANVSSPGSAEPATTTATLQVTTPASAGFDPERLEQAAALLEGAVAEGVTPGGVLLVARRGSVALERAAGRLTYDDDAPAVTPSTIYDLASLTKVIATTTLMMRRVESGALDLDDTAASCLPELEGSPVGGATLRDLLAHTSGLPCCSELFRELGEGLDRDEARARYLEHIAATELEVGARERSIYSDLGVLLLGEILERESGHGLAELVQGEILDPLGLADTGYRPSDSLRGRIAPTEFDSWRGRLPHGEVHDENTHALGGIAPHAGLFGTARDVAAFAQTMLNGGGYGERRIANADTVALFTRRAELVPGSSRALGWDTPSDPSSAGRYFSARSFGHTGFTGTSLWIDPALELIVVLLTNRVHPTRENIAIRRLRPAIHDAVVLAIDDAEVELRHAGQR
ncbi:MAG: serine hydrolase [Holophagales bacterium]|nr:serine hydrolase [Holophagales bacterium]MYG29442.1 serine hydrolase [Holophagales bacterium]MYI80040.1 serine hydrolase [Holophagales bacterium]